MESAEIRSRFLRYFEGKGHTIVPSASLLADDPTLLLVNAGMVPFKPYFLGEAAPPYQRATSVQKCVRTLDIDEVGKTTRHASFFQMCGNFSFGDYFKADAIPFAWELLTKSVSDGGFGFPEDRLWVTVYHDDDESVALWRDQVGVPEGRIQRRGMVDNFWSMGVPGPCGPCSEIYYDRGPQYGAEGGPVADEDRYLEIWNLVFMQFERGAGSGKEDYPIIGELPAKNIDTGMGLERMAAILQGVENIYEIDTTMLVLQRAAEISGRRYGAEHRDDVALRVVADHARTAAFLVADGVLPGNEGRGYVLRRMLRRTVREALFAAFPDSSRLEFDHIEALCDAMGIDTFARDLGDGLRAFTEYGTLIVSGDSEGDSPLAPCLLPIPGAVDLGPAGRLSAVASSPSELGSDPYSALLDQAKLRGSLTVDSVRPGDRMRPLGMTGTRKLQDLLTDAKVPRRHRARVPVVRDGAGIVWLAGVRVSEDHRIGPATGRAVLLRWTGPCGEGKAT